MKLSNITLGTVNFGIDYGLRKGKNKISKKKAKYLIKESYKLGINSFDTSPDYGNAEKILGETLRNKKKKIIATKVFIKNSNKLDFKKLLKSINQSRKNLFQKKLDLLQIHNADQKIIKNKKIKQFFLRIKKEGIIKKIGVTVYSEKEALLAIESGWIKSIQVPYNLINQKMKKKVFILAKKKGVTIYTRSTFLKGVLTKKIYLMPKKIRSIKSSLEDKLNKLDLEIEDLKMLALRFVLSNEIINSTVFGIENIAQLKEIIKTKKFRLDKEYIKKLSIFNSNLKINDPRFWPFI